MKTNLHASVSRSIKGLFLAASLLVCVAPAHAQDDSFVHPGISHKISDLERMKYQVESRKEPWFSTFELLRRSSDASFNYDVRGDSRNTVITNHSDFINDGFAAYHNALMWYMTGDERHAEKAIEIFNAWVNIVRIEDQFALNNGRGPWKMLEAAEIIKSTYSGWASAEINRFKAMLVYPGWSGSSAPTRAMANKDVTFYWNIYQGDPARHGNQGLFAYRSLMAMAIFMDNRVMYDRVVNYLTGQPRRSDDLPYPSGPPVISSGKLDGSNRYYDEYRQLSRENAVEDYGYNEVIEHYIYENGQSQESSRDQTHPLVGLSIIATIAEMAWNQGDDLYGHLDNRPLLGLEFNLRYNLSWENAYPDQPEPWEPTVASGEYIERSDRTGRWHSLAINPYVANDLDRFERGIQNLRPIYEMPLGHYKDRMRLPGEQTRWLERGFELLQDEIGVENGDKAVDYHGFGGLKFRRVSPGDPVSGFSEGRPDFAMNVLPKTIEAEDFDHFTLSGEGRTYKDRTRGNTGNQYRLDENVDIQFSPGAGYNVDSIDVGEWLTYTIYVPESRSYEISVNYAARSSDGTIRFEFDGSDETGEVTLPSTGGLGNWRDHAVARGVTLNRGVQSMRVLAGGVSGSFNLNSITLSDGDTTILPTGERVVQIRKRSAPNFAVDGDNGSGDGQNVYLWSEDESNVNQQWVEISHGGGYHSYRKQDTDYCLDGGNGGANRQNVFLWRCDDGNRNQQWLKTDAGSGYFKLIKRNAPGFALDGGNGGANGQNVQMFDSANSSENLQWSISSVD